MSFMSLTCLCSPHPIPCRSPYDGVLNVSNSAWSFSLMSKLRHIAYRANDVEAMAQFFAGGFEMEIVQRRTNGAIDLSDGTMNVTILPAAMPRGDGYRPIGYRSSRLHGEMKRPGA